MYNIIYNMKNTCSDREFAELYYNLYLGCLISNQHSDSLKVCEGYLKKFIIFGEIYMDNKNQKK